jgi:hypothetical protein
LQTYRSEADRELLELKDKIFQHDEYEPDEEEDRQLSEAVKKWSAFLHLLILL